MNDPLKIVVLASGEGTNLGALIEAFRELSAVKIVGVGSNKTGARALERAAAAAIPTESFELTEFANREARDAAMGEWIERLDADLIVLAGYMQLLTQPFLDRFPHRVINVHPSLLPAFPGVDAIEQAVAYGVKIFGVTVHYVDGGIDTGQIISQESVTPDDPHDTEAVRKELQQVEHRLLPATVLKLATR